MPKFVQNLFKISFAIISTGKCCPLGVLLFLSTFCCDSEERSYQTEVETRANEHVTIFVTCFNNIERILLLLYP